MSVSVSAFRPSRIAVGAECRTLKVGGVTPFTTFDYPGKLAAVVFVQGCPWQCGYCHNPHLQIRLEKSPLRWSKVLGLLKSRVGLIDAVVFSGGEPTLDPALEDAICDVRKLGLDVALHCGGAYPDRLRSVLPLVDWVALDVKAPFDTYDRVTGVSGSGEEARASVEAVISSEVPYEIRTTVHPALLSRADICTMAESLAQMGVANYALQAFRAQGCKTKELKSAVPKDYPGEEMLTGLAKLFRGFVYRLE